jgi:hypothetical protein
VAVEDCVCLAVADGAFDHAMAWLIKHSRLLLDATGVTRFLDGDQSHMVRLGSHSGLGLRSWRAQMPTKCERRYEGTKVRKEKVAVRYIRTCVWLYIVGRSLDFDLG